MNVIFDNTRLAAFLLMGIQGLHAHCGLNFCPRVERAPFNAFEAGFGVHQTGFYLNGQDGQYTEVLPNFQYTYRGKWLLGANLGFAGLNLEGKTHWGLENPLLFGEWRFYPGMGNRMVTGIQVELPFGDKDHGIGTHHAMIVPYGSFGKEFELFFSSATLGFSQAVELVHHEEDAGVDTVNAHSYLYVHPHEDQELLYRVSIGTSLWQKRSSPEVFLNGQRVMVSEQEHLPDEEKNDLTIGILFPFVLGGAFVLSPRLEFPVLIPSRFDWNTGIDFHVRF